MRKMKTALSIVLAAVTCLSMTAFTNGSNTAKTASKKIVVGLTVDALSNAYLKPLVTYAQKEAKKKGITLNVEDAQGNAQTQANQINTFILQKVSAVILNPVDASSELPALKKLKQNKIPCIDVNMKVDNTSFKYCKSYVGSSSTAEGKIAGKLMYQALGSKGGSIVIIEGTKGTDPQIYRTQGFKQEINKHKNIKILSIQSGNWDRAKSQQVAEDLLTKYSNIKGIYCHDDNMCIGAYNAAKADGRASKIKFVGIGGSKDGLAAIKAGKMYGSVEQGPDYEGKTAVDVAYNVIMGKAVKSWYVDPCDAITKSNVSKFKGLW